MEAFKRPVGEFPDMYDRLKGFRDFYPGEMAARRAAFDAVESTAASYGFREGGTPALERTEMYVDKSGEEIVEELDGVSHDDIEHHEEAAETSYYLTILLGLVALMGLFQSIRAGSIPVWMFWVILLVSLVTLGSLARTANDGGKIRHPETEMKAPES